jgi:hypothetical protein
VKTATAILFYEASEGGAGVLSRLVEEPNELAHVAARALEACHFTADGEDLGRAEGAAEACEAACYNCLLGYGNQAFHKLLDRWKARDLLLALSNATASTGAGVRTREQLRDDLLARCESQLERDFIDFLYTGGHRLPDRAQPFIADPATRPDFYYDDGQVCVYVDGPYHDFAERHERDRLLTANLEDSGYTVARVTSRAQWPEEIARHGWVFGGGNLA